MKMDLLPYNNENLLINFPPCLRKNFQELLCHGKLGLMPFTLNDISFNKQYTEDNSSFCYYYTLKISYAGKKLSWELIFNPEDMSFAPDFNFNDDNFHMSCDLDLIVENIPSLVNWNVNDPKSLSSVLKEFLNLFKKQQIERLHTENIYSQLSSEYQQLIEEAVTPNDVEIYVENTCVHLIIILKVDISSLPQYIQPVNKGNQSEVLNPGEDNCILKVSYMKLDSSHVNTSLQLSPRLEQVFENVQSFHLPNYNKTSLPDYVTSIKQLIQDQIKAIEHHHKLKKDFMNCLWTSFDQKMIEFESETFCKAVFLCEVNNYFCIVHVDIGNLFPQEKPTITLQSLYCGRFKNSCLEVLEGYPYSPRWTPQVMLARLVVYLNGTIPQFVNHEH